MEHSVKCTAVHSASQWHCTMENRAIERYLHPYVGHAYYAMAVWSLDTCWLAVWRQSKYTVVTVPIMPSKELECVGINVSPTHC